MIQLAALLLLSAPPELGMVEVSHLESLAEITAAVDAALGQPALRVSDSGKARAHEVKRARGDAVLAAIAATPKACALRTLAFQGLFASATGFKALLARSCLSLHALDVSFTGLDDEGAIALSTAPFARTLRTLQANNNRLTGVGVAELVQGLESIEYLDLGQNAVGAAGAAAIGKARLSKLKSLVLSKGIDGAAIGDQGLAALFESPLESLEKLDLSGNEIGSVGITALINSTALTHLEILILEGNPLDRATVQRLATENPSTQVSLRPPLDGAWSVARARALRVGDVVPSDVLISADQDVSELAGVSEIAGSLLLTGEVQNLAPLSKLTKIGGDLSLRATRKLARLDALAALTSIGGGLSFEANLALTTTAGLKQLRDVGANVLVMRLKGGNPGLREVALPSLERVGGALYVERGKGYLVNARKRALPVEVKIIRPFPRVVAVGKWSALLDEKPTLFPSLVDPPAR